ncbi:MAG: FAD-dependent oxidoreductase [Pseudomonadota bacterium]
MSSVAIIGAGLAGLVIARRLRAHANVRIFEKSRGAGGRIATRYAGDFEFDHGAQFFTAHTQEFARFLDPMIEQGIVANWPARFAELNRNEVKAQRDWTLDYPHYVGVPRMNVIGKHLADGLNISFETEVKRIARESGRWVLFDQANHSLGEYDWLVLTAPPPQTATLAEMVPQLVTLCQERTMSGCYSLMLGFEQPFDLGWDAALVANADISWVSVNSSKPGRGDAHTLLVHSTNAWADANLDAEPESVIHYLMGELADVAGDRVARASHQALHRWRYANIGKHGEPTSFLDTELQVAAAGDWFVRGRIEAAYTSASDLSARLRESI